ncbi:MAG: hypothetical protein NZ899_06990 [Thermoguttaceae bacterium]|nr:hypothetical protein [Thermoguttaceae bacterium]MDW8078488.1 hypothetical protein [Thermoguttaceae bacterium]
MLGLRSKPTESLPTVLPPSPTLDQVIWAVNRNSTAIYNFQTDRAVLSGRDFPSLRAMIVFERPLRLRLRAGTGVTGLELDLGSNDELFWVWVRRDPQLYFCRHAEFAHSAVAQQFPLDPRWVVDALGLVELDPTSQHEGPHPLDARRLRVVSHIATPTGPRTRVVIVDSQTAAVLEQLVYDSQGRLLALARGMRHRRDPLSGLIMPQVVYIESPAFELALQVDLGPVRINRPLEAAPDIWQMPRYEGWVPVDLARTIAYLPTLRNVLEPPHWERRQGPVLAEVPSARIKFR